MISKHKRTARDNEFKVVDCTERPRFLKEELPAAYRRLLGLIFSSPGPLTPDKASHDKISS